MSWIESVTDRELFDVLYARRNADIGEDLKGAINASDLNRIGNNIKVLVALAKVLNIHLEIYHSLQNLRSVFEVYPTTPDIPDWHEMNTYESFNAIEQNLEDMHTRNHALQADYFYVGEQGDE